MNNLFSQVESHVIGSDVELFMCLQEYACLPLLSSMIFSPTQDNMKTRSSKCIQYIFDVNGILECISLFSCYPIDFITLVLKKIRFIYFYVCECFMYMYVCIQHDSIIPMVLFKRRNQIPWNWNYNQLLATMWVLKTKPRARRISALNY